MYGCYSSKGTGILPFCEDFSYLAIPTSNHTRLAICCMIIILCEEKNYQACSKVVL